MKLAIITTRTAGYFPNKRLLQEGKTRGHRVELWNPYQAWPLLAGPRDFGGLMDRRPLAADAALPRVGSQIGDFGLNLVRHLELMGMPVINRADAIALARNKFLTMQALTRAGLPVPPALLVNSAKGFAKALKHFGGGPLVAKELSGRQGSGVRLVGNLQEFREKVAPNLDKRVGLLAQRFIPTEGRRDFRLLVVGGRLVATIELTPPPGDFRANIHLGGRGRLVNLPAKTNRLALSAAKVLGLAIAGVDLMIDANGAPWLVEVNYSPGFRGLENISGLNVAGIFWDYIESVQVMI